VEYTGLATENAVNDSFSTPNFLESSTTSVTISGLVPFSTYTIGVSASTSAGAGPTASINATTAAAGEWWETDQPIAIFLYVVHCVFAVLYLQYVNNYYISSRSSLDNPQPDLLSWRCPQWKCHTDLASPSAPQWCCQVLSGAALISWWRCLCEHNRQHHNGSAVWPDPWYPVHFYSEGLHCGLWTIQWSAHPAHCWRWGQAVLFVTESQIGNYLKTSAFFPFFSLVQCPQYHKVSWPVAMDLLHCLWPGRSLLYSSVSTGTTAALWLYLVVARLFTAACSVYMFTYISISALCCFSCWLLPKCGRMTTSESDPTGSCNAYATWLMYV